MPVEETLKSESPYRDLDVALVGLLRAERRLLYSLLHAVVPAGNYRFFLFHSIHN